MEKQIETKTTIEISSTRQTLMEPDDDEYYNDDSSDYGSSFDVSGTLKIILVMSMEWIDCFQSTSSCALSASEVGTAYGSTSLNSTDGEMGGIHLDFDDLAQDTDSVKNATGRTSTIGNSISARASSSSNSMQSSSKPSSQQWVTSSPIVQLANGYRDQAVHRAASVAGSVESSATETGSRARFPKVVRKLRARK
jgi:hypothetical protein